MRSPLEIAIIPLGRLWRNRRPEDAKSIRHRPELASAESLQVTSTSFPAGGTMPPLYSTVSVGQNVAPRLRWSAVAEEAARLGSVFDVLPWVAGHIGASGAITGYQEG